MICMVRVLVIHCTEKGKLPKMTPEQGEELKKTVGKFLEENPDVTYNGSFLDPDGVGICDFEAPSAEVIERLVRDLVKAPYDVIVPVEKLEL